MLFGILEFEVRHGRTAAYFQATSCPSDPHATKSSRKENWFTGRWPWKSKLQGALKERNEKRGQMPFVYFGTRVVM